MMMAVYNYPIRAQLCEPTEVEMPEGAQVLHVDMQHGMPCVWALVDTGDVPKVRRGFVVVGTGHSFNAEGATFLNTMFHGELVFHAFELAKGA